MSHGSCCRFHPGKLSGVLIRILLWVTRSLLKLLDSNFITASEVSYVEELRGVVRVLDSMDEFFTRLQSDLLELKDGYDSLLWC